MRMPRTCVRGIIPSSRPEQWFSTAENIQAGYLHWYSVQCKHLKHDSQFCGTMPPEEIIISCVLLTLGLSALEVSRDSKMRQLLDVQPLQAVQKTVQRFEGYIMKVYFIIIHENTSSYSL